MRKHGMAGTKHAVLALLFGGLLISIGWAQETAPAGKSAAAAEPAAASGTEKVILKVGANQVTEADFNFVLGGLSPQIQQAVAAEGRRSLGEQYAMMILLSQQAITHQLDSSAAFRRWLALQRIQWLAEAEVNYVESQVKIGPEEVSEYYAANPDSFEEVQVHQVVVRKKPAGASPETPGLSPSEAKTRAEAIHAALAGGKDIKAVAEEFHKSNEVFVGTEPRTFRRGQLTGDLQAAVFQLKDGELSQPLDNEQAFIILRRLGSHRLELEDVAQEIEDLLRSQRVQSTLAEMKSKATVWMDEEFFAAPAQPAAPPAQAPQAGPPPAEQ